MRNALGDLLDGIGGIQSLNVDVSDTLDVLSELLVSLVVLVIERATVEVDDSGESVHVVNCGGGGDLGTETVTTNGSHCDLMLIHEPHDIVGTILQLCKDYYYYQIFQLYIISNGSMSQS